MGFINAIFTQIIGAVFNFNKRNGLNDKTLSFCVAKFRAKIPSQI